MNIGKLPFSFFKNAALLPAVLFSACLTFNASAGVKTTETQKYLVVATGEGKDEFFSFQMSNVEIGANQEALSSGSITGDQRSGKDSSLGKGYDGGLSHRSEFISESKKRAKKDGNRWDDKKKVDGNVDRLPGARPLFQGVDYSGNVALTGEKGKFDSSNSDINADTGIQCNRSAKSCKESSNSAFFADQGNSDPFDDKVKNLNKKGVSSLNNTTELLAELQAQRDWIVELELDHTLDHGYSDRNIKEDGYAKGNAKDIFETNSKGQVITDLDALDKNGDGYAVINIDVGNDAFQLNNTDWILQSTQNTIAIFRMANGTQFDFSNSSIMLGDGNLNSTDVIDELGAIFFQDAYQESNEIFNLNNVVLGGVGLWDFTDFNPDRTSLLSTDNEGNANSVIAAADGTKSGDKGERTLINLQNAQGCAQFISNQILMSNNRWNHCELAQRSEETPDIPEPTQIALFSLALLGLARTKMGKK